MAQGFLEAGEAGAGRAAAARGEAQGRNSLTVGCRPACSCFCCFSSLLKNFWAWERICTAVFVFTWPACAGVGPGL